MKATIKPEVSKKNRYWIEKHRYYELKHFCMQYEYWKNVLNSLDSMSKSPKDLESFFGTCKHGDPTAKCAMVRAYYLERVEMLEKIAKETDPIIGRFILIGVTEGISYDCIKARMDIPCCKDVYYDLYRKFFWKLDKVRK